MTIVRKPTPDQPNWSAFDGFRSPARRTSPLANWSVFDGFERTQRHVSWQGLQEFVEKGRSYAAERCHAFPSLFDRWEQELAELGGDPSTADWSEFRPLRLDREEDWSDWLQHFIATSKCGAFSERLLGRGGPAATATYAGPEVWREDVTDDRRADLVIRWRDGSRTHVEVKVGDQNFAKTAETASKLESKYAGTWTHFVLVPADDVARWSAVDQPAKPPIHVVTWDDVAVALRRSLRRPEESRSWRSWAHGFCGLVEQKLLGHPKASDAASSLSKMKQRLHQISIMKRGLEDV